MEESLEAGLRIVERAREDGLRVGITISVAFGCPFEGAVDEGRVLELAARVAEARPTRSSSQTPSASACRSGSPARRGRDEARRPGRRPLPQHAEHGYANAESALEAGATVLDASVGGLGGCPFAPRATGNIATEDLVYLLHGEGVETGVDLDGLVRVSEWLEGVLGRQLEGQVYRAGVFPPPVPG